MAAGSLTEVPFEHTELLGRHVKLESSAEIVGKKLQYRTEDSKARDIFDLALVLERQPNAIPVLTTILDNKRDVLEMRFAKQDHELREDFAHIDVLEYHPSYGECLARIRAHMKAL